MIVHTGKTTTFNIYTRAETRRVTKLFITW